MNTKFQSRKLLLSFFLIIFALLAIIFRLATFIEGTNFIEWIFGIYAVANTTQSIGTSKKTN